VVEKKVAEGLCKWLVAKGDTAIPFHKIEKKIQELQHLNDIMDMNNRVPGLQSGSRVHKQDGPKFNAMTSMLHDDGALPEQEEEVEIQSRSMSKQVKRVFVKEKDSKKRKREVVPEEQEHASDSPDERRIVVPKNKREHTREKKSSKGDRAALQTIVSELKQARDEYKAMTQPSAGTSGDGGSVSQKPPLKRDLLCRHCNMKLKDGEKYSDHNCKEKKAKSFYCPGCEGPIPKVVDPVKYFEHLHTCPKVE
jgi:hypothetical protein